MTHWLAWFIIGALSILGGILALFNPFAASLTAELMAGWLFILVGLLMLLSALSDRGFGGRVTAALLGAVLLLLGIGLVANPLSGLLTLTLLAAILLLTAGVIRIALGFAAQLARLRWVLILSGALSILLGLMILSNFPQSAAIVLGLYLGIDLISNGVAMVVLALARRSGAQA